MPDLLIGNVYGDLLILLGNGDGTFRPYRKADQAVALAVADLTGNGKPDFIYADQGLDRVVVQYGSDQTTVLGDQATGLLSPGAVKLADLNGDGIPDLIVANSGSNNVLVYPGLGNGQFGPALNGGHGFFVGTNPTGIAVANLNGQPDLIVANSGSNDVSILLDQSQRRARSRSRGRGSSPAGPDRSPRLSATSPRQRQSGHPGQQQRVEQRRDDAGRRRRVLQRPGPADLRRGHQARPDLRRQLRRQARPGDGQRRVERPDVDLRLHRRRSGDQYDLLGRHRPGDGLQLQCRARQFDDLVVGNSGDGVLALFEGAPRGWR